MKRLRTYSQLEPYLTPKARETIDQLVELGVRDMDLAITVAETLLKEEDLYDLPERDESREN